MRTSRPNLHSPTAVAILCRDCRHEIKKGAKKCSQCGSWQGAWRYVVPLAAIASFVSILIPLIGILRHLSQTLPVAHVVVSGFSRGTDCLQVEFRNLGGVVGVLRKRASLEPFTPQRSTYDAFFEAESLYDRSINPGTSIIYSIKLDAATSAKLKDVPSFNLVYSVRQPPHGGWREQRHGLHNFRAQDKDCPSRPRVTRR